MKVVKIMPIKVESIVLGGPNAELFPSSVSSNLNFDALILSGNNAKELSVIIKNIWIQPMALLNSLIMKKNYSMRIFGIT